MLFRNVFKTVVKRNNCMPWVGLFDVVNMTNATCDVCKG